MVDAYCAKLFYGGLVSPPFNTLYFRSIIFVPFSVVISVRGCFTAFIAFFREQFIIVQHFLYLILRGGGSGLGCHRL